jgi:hypothetical protein
VSDWRYTAADDESSWPAGGSVSLGRLVAGVVGLTARAARSTRGRVDQTWAPAGRDDGPDEPTVLDLSIGMAVAASRTAGRMVAVSTGFVRPWVELVLRPPLVPTRYSPQRGLDLLADRGRWSRSQGEREVRALVDQLLPIVVDAVLDRIDLTQVVLDRVKLMRIVDEVDVNAVAARLDLDPIINRVPIDHVLELVDIDGVVARVNLDPIIARVNVNAIAAEIDLDAIVSRIDLAGLANQVIDEIDLPEIIRESSGAIASETVVGVRMQGIEADERVNRIMDRLLLRRRGRDSVGPDPVEAADDAD